MPRRLCLWPGGPAIRLPWHLDRLGLAGAPPTATLTRFEPPLELHVDMPLNVLVTDWISLVVHVQVLRRIGSAPPLGHSALHDRQNGVFKFIEQDLHVIIASVASAIRPEPLVAPARLDPYFGRVIPSEDKCQGSAASGPRSETRVRTAIDHRIGSFDVKGGSQVIKQRATDDRDWQESFGMGTRAVSISGRPGLDSFSVDSPVPGTVRNRFTRGVKERGDGDRRASIREHRSIIRLAAPGNNRLSERRGSCLGAAVERSACP